MYVTCLKRRILNSSSVLLPTWMKPIYGQPTAINNVEFSHMLKNTKPPVGWSNKIAVANSGGPDSTCLLFLINRYLLEHPGSSSQPQRVISFTVDHDLQKKSSDMANHCRLFAQSIGVEHITSKIPWGEGVYPPRPSPGDMFERTARDARYALLLQTLTRADVDVLAVGHHADDQVETALMRLGMGSTQLGAGGMRACRRWGMGAGIDERSLSWAGHKGMSKWIVRPLLDVGKDRILATCEQNNLEYITDPTNFQPHITIRNAIRRLIDGTPDVDHLNLPPDIIEKVESINKSLSSVPTSLDLTSGLESLRGAVKFFHSQLEDVDSQVDSILKRCRLPSPPGTFLMALASVLDVNRSLLQQAMVIRILRTISFYPWGSLQSEAGRRQLSLKQIITKLWNPDPFTDGIKPFVAGGGVLWKPVVYRREKIKDVTRVSDLLSDDTVAWLASRQPPFDKKNELLRMAEDSSLFRDITNSLVDGLDLWKTNNGPEYVEVLFDCRFLVSFRLPHIPIEILSALMSGRGKLLLQASSRWYSPLVLYQEHDTARIIHSLVSDDFSGAHSWDNKSMEEKVSVDWIVVKFIRTLNAI